jgi:formylglycine-generating enzyme required for sulfatase activity
LNDPRDDVFAFGVLVYNCLTGKLPVRDKQKWTSGEVKTGLQNGTKIPDDLLELIARCLERDPQLRSTFADVVQELSSAAFIKEIQKWERENAFCKKCGFVAGPRIDKCPICGQQMWERIARPPQTGMVRIEAGRFTHGLDAQQIEVAIQAAGNPNAPPDYRQRLADNGHRSVFMPAFDIDVYPVTNAEFLEFSEEMKYPSHESLTYKAQKLPDHPVVHVTWRDALCYALWKQRRLPSPLEWEKAARGDRDARPYPWGSVWRPDLCNNSHDHAETKTTPVARYAEGPRDGRSPFGIADLVGNVNEWVNQGTKQGMKAVRGGSWAARCVLEGLVSNELVADVEVEDETVGFRCAADVVYDDVLVKTS